MKQVDNIIDIQIQSVIDVELPENSIGNVYVLGHRAELSAKIREINDSILNYLDRSATFYKYNLEVLEMNCDDYNIICPFQDVTGDKMYFATGKADTDELDFAIPTVIDLAEIQLRKFYEEALVRAAMENPELYRAAIDKVFVEEDDYISKSSISASEASEIKWPAEASFDMSPGVDAIDAIYDDDVESDVQICSFHAKDADVNIKKSDESIHESYSSQKPSIGQITAKQKKEAFKNLPRRLTNAFEKQNPTDYEIVRQTMCVYTATEINAILQEVAKKDARILKLVQSTALNAASCYEIHVRPWKSIYGNEFRDRYLYCIYLKNKKGKEYPVTFKNYPSYCIYMMYIIDRVQRGEEVTDLILKNLRNEFCQLYKTILSETDANIRNFYDEMDYRKVAKTGKMRKGRYDDYIRDIHETLESLVGEIDSIPLKVGHGRYLGILPERIFLDKNLAKFKFA